jgi:hypothetical protein
MTRNTLFCLILITACEGQVQPEPAAKPLPPLTLDDCDYSVAPPIGTYTPDFEAPTECNCDPSTPDCRSLWRSRVVELDEEGLLTIEITKAQGTEIQADARAEVRLAGEGLTCYQIEQAEPLEVGEIIGGETTARFEVSPFDPPLEEGSTTVSLVVITGGSDNPDALTWWSPDPLVVVRTCAR